MSSRTRSKAILEVPEAPAIVATESPVPSQLYPIDQLPKRPWMPKRRGRGVSYFTVLRWALNGKGGLKLRSLMVGRQRCTTDEWALAFFEQLTNGAATAANKPSAGDHENALRELEAAGV